MLIESLTVEHKEMNGLPRLQCRCLINYSVSYKFITLRIVNNSGRQIHFAVTPMAIISRDAITRKFFIYFYSHISLPRKEKKTIIRCEFLFNNCKLKTATGKGKRKELEK